MAAILNFIPSARDLDCPPKFFTYLGCTTKIKRQNEGTSDCTQPPPLSPQPIHITATRTFQVLKSTSGTSHANSFFGVGHILTFYLLIAIVFKNCDIPLMYLLITYWSVGLKSQVGLRDEVK